MDLLYCFIINIEPICDLPMNDYFNKLDRGDQKYPFHLNIGIFRFIIYQNFTTIYITSAEEQDRSTK